MVGHPVSHSQSPRIHREFGQQFGLDIHYGLLDVDETEFDTAVREFFLKGGLGLNVTVPHKERAARWVGQCSELAAQANSVNTIGLNNDGTSWGDNTDGPGLVTDLTQNHHISLKNKNLLILGAGGAARGVLPSLVDQAPQQMGIYNRSEEKAVALTQGYKKGVNVMTLETLEDTSWDLIINATSAGLTGNTPSIPESIFAGHTVVYDLQYGPASRPFLDWATQMGVAQTLDGWGMLVEQAALAFYLWHGLSPSTHALLRREGDRIRPS